MTDSELESHLGVFSGEGTSAGRAWRGYRAGTRGMSVGRLHQVMKKCSGWFSVLEWLTNHEELQRLGYELSSLPPPADFDLSDEWEFPSTEVGDAVRRLLTMRTDGLFCSHSFLHDLYTKTTPTQFALVALSYFIGDELGLETNEIPLHTLLEWGTRVRLAQRLM